MELILNRLLNPAVIVWIVVALIGVLSSAISWWIMIMQIRLHPPIMRLPAVASMKRHDLESEVVRVLAQACGFVIGVGYVTGLINGPVAVWALVLMNTAMVVNSISSLILTVRQLGGLRVVLRLLLAS